MELLAGFIIGLLLALLLVRHPIVITIKHVEETNEIPISDEKLRDLEQQMFKQDPNLDKLYNELGVDTQEIADIMGGSDR